MLRFTPHQPVKKALALKHDLNRAGNDKMEDFIYYISANSIDQLYRKWVGPISNEILDAESKEKSHGIGAKLGVSQLLAVLSTSVNGSLTKKNIKSRQTKSESHIEERANSVIELIKTKNIPDIIQFNSKSVCDFYKFQLTLEILEKFLKNKQGTIIEVKALLNGIEIYGTTSYENWIAGSILNTILYDAEETKIPASGILMPISYSKKQGRILLLAQYLIIVKPEISYEKR